MVQLSTQPPLVMKSRSFSVRSMVLLFITNGGCVESCTIGSQDKAAGFDPTIKPGNGWDLCAHRAAFHAAAVGDDQQIILGQVDIGSLARVLHGDRACQLAALLDIELDIGDLGVQFHYNTKVTNIEFELTGGKKQARTICLLVDDEAERVDLTENDLVFITNGGCVESTSIG